MSLSADQSAGPTLLRSLRPPTLVLLAVVLFGFSVRGNSPGSTLAIVVAVAAIARFVLGGRHADEGATPTERQYLAAILVFSALGAAGWAPYLGEPTSIWLEHLPGVAWALLGLGLYLSSKARSRVPIAIAIAGLTIAFTLVFGLLHLSEVGGIGSDVTMLHVEAAEAIGEGQNPYTDAVSFPDGSPEAEPGAMITGYPYPPVAAVAYAGGEWGFSDPRYTSLASWIVVLVLVGWLAFRSRKVEPLYLMLLLASIPGWPLILRAGSTEPLSLAFITAAFVVWRKPVGSGIGLGLALASKQYFFVTAPLVALHRDEGWVRRLVVTVVVVVTTVGAAMLLDVSAFWSAGVEFHSTTPPRADSSNLVGLLANMGIDWAPPPYLSIIVGFAAAIATGRLSRSRSLFVLGMALTLSASFLVSSQAFANYWFLITGLCVLGLFPVHAHDTEKAKWRTSILRNE